MTDYIKAPFNFVPVSDKVFFPPWADRISQDIPFRGSLSGTIHLTITAETPMFIRNGSDRKDSSFSHLTGASGKPWYFIPGSSIKGEVRSTLEIMSFSKMRVDESAAFTLREIGTKKNKLYDILDDIQSVHCGWLRQNPDGEGCVIYDHGFPYRISLKRIDEYLGSKMLDHFMAGNRSNHNEDLTDEQKSAMFKYHLVKESGHELKDLEHLPYLKDEEAITRSATNRVRIAPKSGDRKGTIVFTGQPGKRKGNTGKFYEFVFPDECKGTYPIDAEMLRHFKFIYFSTTANEKESKKDEIKWLKGLLNDPEKGLPVFFRLGKGNVKDFGLAYLYKLPYSRTPYTSLPPEHRNKQHHDLAECIFGYTSPDGRSLRGRVHFGSAFSDNAESDTEPVLLALSSPKASYYPIYIRQKGKEGIAKKYDTYNDGSLSGWKRYHVRQNPLTGDGTYAKNKDGTPNINLNTPICPVKKGAVFTSDITFHNLLPEELGALLSALTFHNTKGCFHQLGQGKPYGYGRSTYEVALDMNLAARAGEFMASFEKKMNDFTMESLGTQWLQSEQMTSLIFMAHEKVDGQGYNSADFEYMHMDSDAREQNEFLQAKHNLEYLRPVSERPRKTKTATLEGELVEDRKEKMASLVKSVLVHLQERGGEPDEEIKSQLQNLENDKGARLVLASLRYECEKKMRLQKEAEEEAKRRQEEAEAQKKLEQEEEKRRQEEEAARKKLEQEEAAAQKRESSRAILKTGFEKFMSDVPQSYEDWRKKIRAWLEILRKSGEGRKELSNDETSLAFRLIRKFYQSVDSKKRKAINYREASKLIGRTFTERDLKQ